MFIVNIIIVLCLKYYIYNGFKMCFVTLNNHNIINTVGTECLVSHNFFEM